MMKIFFIALLAISHVQAKSLPANLGLQKLNGEEFSLSEGKRQLVYFWATWCKSCLPKMKKVLPALKTQEDINVVTINMDKDIRRAKKYYKKMGIKLPVYRDGKKIFEKELKIKTLPHWAIIEKKDDSWQIVADETAFNLERVKKYFK